MGESLMIVMMRVVLVLFNLVGRDVPAAIITGGGFLKARIAVQRSALEILFESILIFRRQIAWIARKRQLVAATVTLTQVPLREERRVVIVRPAAQIGRAH